MALLRKLSDFDSLGIGMINKNRKRLPKNIEISQRYILWEKLLLYVQMVVLSIFINIREINCLLYIYFINKT